MNYPYNVEEPISIQLINEAKRETILLCDKVLYEHLKNKCLVLECSQYNIIIKLCVLLNPKGDSFENVINDESLSYFESIEKEYNLLKSYSQKKPEYFINVYEFVPLQSIKIYTKCFDGPFCFVTGYSMEKMYGDLKILWNSKKTIGFQKDEIFNIWIKLLEILSYMQTEGLCHRDIKLQNIFIDKKRQIKLGDFGSSKELARKNMKLNESIRQYKNIDKLMTYVGTEIYMAPEIFCSNKGFDLDYNPFKSDLFSTGITILNLLTFKMNKLHDFFDEFSTYKEELIRLTKYCSNNIKNALFIMLELEDNKRPDIYTFYNHHFRLIFKEEIEKKDFGSFYFNSPQTNTTLNTKGLPNMQNKNDQIIRSNNNNNVQIKEEIDSNQTLQVNNRKFIDVKNQNYVLKENDKPNGNEDMKKQDDEYDQLIYKNSYSIIEEEKIKQKINQGEIILFDEKSLYFKQNLYGNTTRIINIKCFYGKFLKTRCIFRKHKMNNKENTRALLEEFNFVFNLSLVNNIGSLVRYFSTIKEGSDFYVVSEYVEPPILPLIINQEKKEFYNLFTLLTNKVILADYFKKDEKVTKIYIIKEVVNALYHLKKHCHICFGDLDASKVLITRNFKIKLKDYYVFDSAFKLNGMLGSFYNPFISEKKFVCLPPEFYMNYISKEKSDMWGLGVLIHQVFSYTKNPWGLNKGEEYIVNVALNPESDKLSGVSFDNIPIEFTNIIKNLLNRNFEKRMTIEQVMKKLDMFN
jgi:serine/threonine protein kinase